MATLQLAFHKLQKGESELDDNPRSGRPKINLLGKDAIQLTYIYIYIKG